MSEPDETVRLDEEASALGRSLDERVRLRVLERLACDRERGAVAPIEAYFAAFPGFEWLVRQEYAAPRGSTGPTHLAPGGTFGRFQLEQCLGSGGQGTVWLALDVRLTRRVALKILPERPTLPGSAGPPPILAREVEALARLQHPGVAGVHEVGVHESRPYLVMRYVPGRTLAAVLEEWRGSAPPLRERLRLVHALADAAGSAHALGVIHRDIKPANVIVEPNGTPVLIDFGLARAVDSELPSVTRTGDILGTPRYMPPERWRGLARDDPRGDVFSLGVIAFEATLLRPPFDGPTVEVIARAIERDEPSFAVTGRRSERLPVDLRAIIATALEKRIDRRYADAGQLAADLGRHLEGHPVAARRPSAANRLLRWMLRNPAAAALFTLILLLAGGAIAVAVLFRRVAEDERTARIDVLTAVARSEADRGRLVASGEGLGRNAAALERFRSAVAATREAQRLAATGELPDLDRLRSDAAAALSGDDYVVDFDIGTNGLGRSLVDSRGLTLYLMGVSGDDRRVTGEIRSAADGSWIPAVEDPSEKLDGVTAIGHLARMRVACERNRVVFVEGKRRVTAQVADLAALASRSDLASLVFRFAEFDPHEEHCAATAIGPKGALLCVLTTEQARPVALRALGPNVPAFLHFSSSGSRTIGPNTDGSGLIVEALEPGAASSGRIDFRLTRDDELVLDARLSDEPTELVAIGLISGRNGLALRRQRHGAAVETLNDLSGWYGPRPTLAVASNGRWVALANGGRLMVQEVDSGRTPFWATLPSAGAADLLHIDTEGSVLLGRRAASVLRLRRRPGLEFETAMDSAPAPTVVRPIRLTSKRPSSPGAKERFALEWSSKPEEEISGASGTIPLAILASDQHGSRVAVKALVAAEARTRGCVLVFEVGARSPSFSRLLDSPVPKGGVALSPDGRSVAALDGNQVVLFDLDRDREILRSTVRTDDVLGLSFLDTGDLRMNLSSGGARDLHLVRLEARLRALGLPVLGIDAQP